MLVLKLNFWFSAKSTLLCGLRSWTISGQCWPCCAKHSGCCGESHMQWVHTLSSPSKRQQPWGHIVPWAAAQMDCLTQTFRCKFLLQSRSRDPQCFKGVVNHSLRTWLYLTLWAPLWGPTVGVCGVTQWRKSILPRYNSIKYYHEQPAANRNENKAGCNSYQKYCCSKLR